MRKLLLAFVLMLVAGVSVAQDSGLYYDELRDGEGILLLRSMDTFVMYFFTYGAHECDEINDLASLNGSNGSDCDYNGQRWFYAVVAPEEDDEEPSTDSEHEFGGTMYMTRGINYPDGEPHDLIPFVHNVGKNIAIGKFILRRNLGGWLMDVAPTGNALDEDDFIFERIFKFEKRLFVVDEPVATPK